MPEDESQKLWKGQEDEALTMLSRGEMCSRARFFEKEGVWLFRGVIAVTLLIVPAYIFRSMTEHNAWQIFSLGLILAVWCRFVWEFRKGTAAERCVRTLFVIREANA